MYTEERHSSSKTQAVEALRTPYGFQMDVQMYNTSKSSKWNDKFEMNDVEKLNLNLTEALHNTFKRTSSTNNCERK